MGRESSGISAKETRGGSLHIAEILFRQAACKTNNYFGDSVWVISEFSVKHWPVLYIVLLVQECKYTCKKHNKRHLFFLRHIYIAQ